VGCHQHNYVLLGLIGQMVLMSLLPPHKYHEVPLMEAALLASWSSQPPRSRRSRRRGVSTGSVVQVQVAAAPSHRKAMQVSQTDRAPSRGDTPSWRA
jgi:hypothetical protein